MLNICTASECTTIVFGHGTCVEHDERDLTVTQRLVTEAVTGPEHQGDANPSLSVSSS